MTYTVSDMLAGIVEDALRCCNRNADSATEKEKLLLVYTFFFFFFFFFQGPHLQENFIWKTSILKTRTIHTTQPPSTTPTSVLQYNIPTSVKAC